ncbi:myelin protein P0-like, partial [Pyrgilauda ruficollis]|uniref:myelin protein P0-like n=1 Tax=Pyrgilauda ruficollis TaxID=221976 RepID=UPI001B87230F
AVALVTSLGTGRGRGSGWLQGGSQSCHLLGDRGGGATPSPAGVTGAHRVSHCHLPRPLGASPARVTGHRDTVPSVPPLGTAAPPLSPRKPRLWWQLGDSADGSVSPGVSPVSPIHVYTPRELYGTVGSRVTLSCSFWSSEWISEDISITWHFQADGSRDSISIFHYAKGQPYIDDVGTFKERMEWAGNPRRRDGSIVIHSLEPSDNGTFTCDVKNPPDIVGKSSQVTLYVLEKVPPRYGVVLGSVIGGALLLVAVLVALAYGTRYCWRRRQAALQRRLSAMEKGKLQRSGKDGSKRSRQAPVLYAMLDHGRSAKKAKGDSRKDRK